MPASGRDDVAARDGRSIVVGVDGSAAARTAVRWAADHARELDRALVLVHAREDGRPTPFPAIPADGDDEVVLAPYRAELGEPPPDGVRHRIVDGPPARALIAASTDAVMIVLGRAPGGLTSWPGPASVTRRVLAGARCPVVLVPERPKDVP